MAGSCLLCATPLPGEAKYCPSCGSPSPHSGMVSPEGGPPPPLPPRYRVVRFLGRGGMGRVFLCRDADLEVDVAVKVLPSELSADPGALEQVRREARIAASLRGGPGILPLHAFESHGGTWFLVEEFAAGGSLQERVQSAGALPEADCRGIGAELAGALSFAHGRRVLHRDVKTSNVLMDAGGRCLLADFGLAKALADASSRGSDSSIVGTPVYMAPEVMWHGKMDQRSDLYALGCVLYEIATGKRPFEGTYHEIARAKEGPAARVPDPREANPAISEEYSGIVRRLLAPDPAARFPDAESVAAALRPGAATPAAAGPARVPVPRPFVIAASERFSQRIRPYRRAMGMGLLTAVLGGAAVAASVLAFREGGAGEETTPGTRGASPGAESTPTAELDMSGLPADAEVYLDGRRLPRGAAGHVPVAAGPRSISLVREGFETVVLPDRTLRPGEVLRVDPPVWHRAGRDPAVPDASPPPPALDLAGVRLPAGVAERQGRLFSEQDGAEMVLIP